MNHADEQRRIASLCTDGASSSDTARRQERYWDLVDGLDDIDTPATTDGFALIHYAVHNTHVLRDVLRRGGNPNLQTNDGDVPLHLSVQNRNVESTRLLLEAGANPNVVEHRYGNPPLWYAITCSLGAEGIVLLRRYGADTETLNRAGHSPRSIVEENRRESPRPGAWDDTFRAMTQHIDLEPDRGTDPPTRAIPMVERDQNDPRRVLLCRIWKEQVPPRGQASTVQGELLRCLARLEDEANHNGNVNYDRNYTLMRNYARKILLDATVFGPERLEMLRADFNQIRKNAGGLIGDHEAWDRLNLAVADWCLAHPDPIPRAPDPKLHR